MSSERKRRDRESKYRYQSGSTRNSIPRWVDMANFNDGYDGYKYTDQWRQLSLKYAPNYYVNESVTKHSRSMADSSSSRDTASTMQSDLSGNQITRGRQRHKVAFILVVVGLVAIAAVIIPVLIITLKPADSQPDKYMVVTMNLTVIETFRDEYTNRSSSEYKSFEHNFTNAMDQIYKNSTITGYNGIQIQSLRNGSVIVTFIIVIVVKQVEEPPREQALKAVITEQPKVISDETIVEVTNIKIRAASVSVALIEYVKVNPITTEGKTTTTTAKTLTITTPTLKASTTTITTKASDATTTPTPTTTTTTRLPTNPSSSTTTTATITTTSTITTKGTTHASTTLSSPLESNTTNTTTSTPKTTTSPTTSKSASSSTPEPNTANSTASTPTTTARSTLTSSPSSPTPGPNTTSMTTSTTTTTTQSTTIRSTEPNTTSTTTSTPTTTIYSISTSSISSPTLAPSTTSTTTSTPTTTTHSTSTSSISSPTMAPNTTSTTTSTPTTTTQPTTTRSTEPNTTRTTTSTPTTTTQSTTTRSTSSSTPEPNTTSTTTATPTKTTHSTSTSSTSSPTLAPNTTSTTTLTPTTTTQSTTTRSTSSSTPEPNTTSTISSTPTTTTHSISTSSTSSPTLAPSTTSTTTSTPTTTTHSTSTSNTSSPTLAPNTTSTTTLTPTTTTQPTTTRPTEPNSTSTTTSTRTTTTQSTSTRSTSSSTPEPNTTSTTTATPTTTTHSTSTSSTSSPTLAPSTTSTTTSTPTTTTQSTSTRSTSSSTPEPNTTNTTTSTPTTTTQSSTTRSTTSSTPEPNTTSTTTSIPTTTTHSTSTSSTSSPTLAPSTTSTATSTPSTTTQSTSTRSTSSSTPEPNTTNTTTSTPTTTTQSSTTRSTTSSTPEPNTTSTTTSIPTTTTHSTSTSSTSSPALAPSTTSTATSIPTTITQPTTTKSTSAPTQNSNTTSTTKSTPTITARSTTTSTTHSSTIFSSTPEMYDTSITSTTRSTTQSATDSSTSSPITEQHTHSTTTWTPTTTTKPSATSTPSSSTPEPNTTSTTTSDTTTTTQTTTTRSTSSTPEQNTASTIISTFSTVAQSATESQLPLFAEVTMKVTLDETFKPEYTDSGSSEYKSFVQNFTNAMDLIYTPSNITGYKGIQIQELRNGSLIVIFIIVIEVKQHEIPPQAETLVAVITQHPTDQVDTTIVMILNIRIRKASVTVVTIVVGMFNPITTSTTTRITSTASTTTPTTTTTPATTNTSATMPETTVMTSRIPAITTTTHFSSTSSAQDKTISTTTSIPSITTQPSTTSTTLPSITTQPSTTSTTLPSITTQPSTTSTTLPSITTQPSTTSTTLPSVLQPNTTSTTASTPAATTLPTTTSTTYYPTPQPNTSSTRTSVLITTTQQTATSTILPPTPESNTANKTTSTPTATAATTLTTRFTTTTTSSSIVTDTTEEPTMLTQQPTTATDISVAFNKNNYTSILGTPLQLICIVTGWNGNLNISRVSKLSQSEVNVISFVNNETGSIHAGFAVNKTFSERNAHVFIFILNMTCDDEGTYYCRSGSASDVATVKREREKPKLQLPDIMIRDDYHNVKYPFVCETEVETPGEILIAEVNRNGTFYFYEGYGESRENITTDCGKNQRFKFYINGRFTQDWDNAKIRCVAINNLTNEESGIRLISDEKTIQLLPAEICTGVAEGSNISHPHSDCELFLTCQTGVPVLGKCQQGQCFYDNIGICRAPNCPFLYCRDTEVNIGYSASITCKIYFCNYSFSFSIKHSEEIVFSNNNISGNSSLKSDDKDVHISVTRGSAEVTFTLNETNCNHIGEYIIDLDRGSFTDHANLRLKVPPKRPTLQLPQSIVAYTETTITCFGEQGVPQQNMYIEVMFNRGNFSKYDKTTLTTNRQNCSNMGTLVMTFLVGEMWDGARIRCVIGDSSSSRLESDVHEINTTKSGVSFSSTELSGFLNDTVQMNCTVNGVFNGDNVTISRSKTGIFGEEILTIITFGNATKRNLTGIQISSTNLSVTDMIVHIIIDSVQCHDGGTYYCKSGNRTATTSLEVWRKPDKPKLKLPVDVISDGYNQGGDPFVCEGNVGYPGGDLIVLFNKDGIFKEGQPFMPTKTTGNVTECGRVDRFEFYLTKFTSDLHNSTVRCVATNNKTLPNESAPFDDKVLLLVPENKCYGVTEGLHLPYPYPLYDCGKYLYCSWNRTFVRDGGCKDGECYYTDINRCEQERTTTTTRPTTTTQPTCPSITCMGAEPVINSAATINCAMILCGDDFDLTIELESKIQFRETMRGNNTSSFLSNATLNLVVKDKTADLSIVFENILCNQSGAYNVSIYGGNVSSVATLRVRVNPEKPNITAPLKIYKDQKAIVSCIGQLGIPNASMFWQLMLPGGNFERYSVSGSPDISKSDCSVIGNWTIEVYPEQSWNGGGIRCVTKTQDTPSVEIHSDVIAIALEEPDIYFVPSSSSGYIGSPHSLTCIARDITNIMSVKIERQTASGLQEVASVTVDGTRTTNFIGIRIRSTSRINSTAATIYTDFDNLTCADKGDYFCTIGVFSSRGNLSVLRKPEVPQLITFPTSGILENTASGTINCTGEVGYPARKIVFETNKGGNNTFIPAPFSLATVKIEGECSTTYSATFSHTFNLDWNSTVIRCKINTDDVLDDNGISLHADRKVLIIPGNICETSNAIYVPHPYACGKYVWCADRIHLSDCSATLCHWTVPDNNTACGYTCNGCFDSF